MDGNQFIDAIQTHVRDSAIKGMRKVIVDPPGRSWGNPCKVADRTAWVRSLDDEGRRHLDNIIRHSVHAAVFGFLAVLDGVWVVEDAPDRGWFELFHKSSQGETLLNGPHSTMLHEIYKGDLEI